MTAMFFVLSAQSLVRDAGVGEEEVVKTPVDAGDTGAGDDDWGAWPAEWGLPEWQIAEPCSGELPPPSATPVDAGDTGAGGDDWGVGPVEWEWGLPEWQIAEPCSGELPPSSATPAIVLATRLYSSVHRLGYGDVLADGFVDVGNPSDVGRESIVVHFHHDATLGAWLREVEARVRQAATDMEAVCFGCAF